MQSNSKRYFNRELSWLEFNQRVLNEALDRDNPLLERLKFLAIVSSNLDEFFMVRVGGLYLVAREGIRRKDIAGMTPLQQIRAIAKRAHTMVEDQYRCFREDVEPALKDAGFSRLPPSGFSKAQAAYAEQYFESELLPLLSPIALRDDRRFPLLVNTRLSLLCRLRNSEGEEDCKYALIPISNRMDRFITLPSSSGYFYTLVEDIVRHFIARIFPGEEVIEVDAIRIARNADMAVREDEAADLLAEMKEVLTQRKKSSAVRLEIEKNCSRNALGYLRRRLEIETRDIYRIDGPVNLADFMELALQEGFDELKLEPWPPQPTPEIDAESSIFDAISSGDILLHHPYEHFQPVLRLVEEAAKDPDVLAIKQILYRTSHDSPIIAALREAAQRGKYVTVLVELKARFDEARNIGWAEKLEEDGVQVVYGVRGFKTHAKLLLVVRREREGIVRYLHLGTGNYNEKTARLYTDISYMTRSEELAVDASAFFNAITGYSQPQSYQRISAAPLTMRKHLLTLIDEEIERCKQGQKGLIMLKVNSLSDREMIDALYRASRAGVEVKLNVRGICCLRPGVKGLSENISVVSVVDRFLEHSRIIYFHHGGDSKIHIASADWMPRNLDKRIELLTPVDEKKCKRKLASILKAYFKDSSKAWTLLRSGEYIRGEPEDGRRLLSSQQFFHKEAIDSVKKRKRAAAKAFDIHRPS